MVESGAPVFLQILLSSSNSPSLTNVTTRWLRAVPGGEGGRPKRLAGFVFLPMDASFLDLGELPEASIGKLDAWARRVLSLFSRICPVPRTVMGSFPP